MMYKLRKISNEYYLRPIIASWLIFSMLAFPVQVALGSANPGADALPGGIIDSTGIGSFDYGANQLVITQTAEQAVTNWNNFDIGQNSSVQFIQPGVSSAVLNRVHDGNPTGIMGSLMANGRVFIVNPAGVVFGGGASVNVAQLVASSLDIQDHDFINGNYDFSGIANGDIENYGSIEAAQGVALIGRKVLNAGTIKTGKDGFVVMASGDKVLLGQAGSKIVVEMSSVSSDSDGSGDVINEGQIESDGGQIILASGDIFSMAANLDTPAKVDGGKGRVGQFGTINADSSDGDGGSVILTAADAVVLGSESVTTANAGANEDGGEVIAYSPDTALFRQGAMVESKGGSQSGNGGFFDLSGKEHVEVYGDIDLTASNGQAGTFLIDPRNIKVIAEGAGSEEGDFYGYWDTWVPDDYDYGDNEYSRLPINRLEYYLSKSNVTLETDYSSSWNSQTGWVWFDAGRDVENSTDNSLTVNALNWIKLDSGLNFTGSGDVTLNAKTDIATNDEINLAGGKFAAHAGNSTSNGILSVKEDIIAGSIELTAGNLERYDSGTCKVYVGYDPVADELYHAGEGTFSDVSLTSTSGDITVESVHDIFIGGNVTSAGNISLVGDVEGAAGHPEFGGDIITNGDVSASGKIDYFANAIKIGGNVAANGGDLTIVGRSSKDEDNSGSGARGTVLDRGAKWGDVEVASNKTLSADGDIKIIDNSKPAGDTMKLTGHDKLTIRAGNDADDQITSDAIISVTGSTLVMQQGADLDTADYLFANQGYTDLTLISDEGYVYALNGTNGADKWASIGATAKDDIKMSGTGNIQLGNSGTADKSLYAKEGDIEVGVGSGNASGSIIAQQDIEAVMGDVTIETLNADWNVSLKNVTAGDDLTVRARHHIVVDGDAVAKSGDVALRSDTDNHGGGHVNVTGEVSAVGGSVSVEGASYVKLDGGATASGDIALKSHGLINSGHQDGGGDVIVGGALTSTNGNIEIRAQEGDPTTWVDPSPLQAGDNNPAHPYDGDIHVQTMDAGVNIDLYSADSTTYLHDDATAGGTIMLHNNTIADDSVTLDAGQDVILSDSKTLDGLGDLTAKAGRSVILGGETTAVGDLDLQAGYNVQAKADLSAGSNLTINAKHGIDIQSADSGGNMNLNADFDHYWGQDVVANGALSSDGTMMIEGSNVDLKQGASSGDDMTIIAHGLYKLTTPDDGLAAGGDVYVAGELSSSSNIDITAIGFDGSPSATGPTLTGGSAAYTSDGSIYLNNKATATENINLTAGQDIHTDVLDAGGDMYLLANRTPIEDTADIQTKTLEAGGKITAEGEQIYVDGFIRAGSVELTTIDDLLKGGIDSDIDVTGKIKAVDEIVLNSNDSVHVGGDILSEQSSVEIYANSDNLRLGGIELDGKVRTLNTESGDIIIEVKPNNDGIADGDIKLHDKVDSAKSLTVAAQQGDIKADSKLESQTQMLLTSEDGSITVDGKVSSGDILMADAGEDITLNDQVESVGDMTMTAGDDITLNADGGQTKAGGSISLTALDDVDVYGNLTSTGGSISIYSSDETTHLGGNVTASQNVLLNNNTEFIGSSDQSVTAQNGTLTAKGYIFKDTAGDLLLYGGHDSADEVPAVDLQDSGYYYNTLSNGGNIWIIGEGDVQLGGNVAAATGCDNSGGEGPLKSGGVWIESKTGKVYTEDGANNDTLNVTVSGSSDHMRQTGVYRIGEYPFAYDVEQGEYLPRAAIVIVSNDSLNLGSGAELNAYGTYYDEVDDRGYFELLDEDAVIGGYDRDQGVPFDLAVYAGSKSGDVDVAGAVSIRSHEMVGEEEYECVSKGAMVIDALETVTFGSNFESSLADGEVGDRLEVVSRLSEWLEDAYGRLPYADPTEGIGPFPDGYNYVLRGAGQENEDIVNEEDGRAWVLENEPVSAAAPLPVIVEPLVEGCPVLLDAAAIELGVTTETIQVSIERSLALSPNIQPCETCASLMQSAAILQDADGSKMAAMAQIFNQIAPMDMPPTPEMFDSIALAFANNLDNPDAPQYAAAYEYAEAFVQYIAAVNKIGEPVGDATAYALDKYGQSITGNANANIGAYVMSRLGSLGGE